jgi:hypothetical protein
VQRPVLYIAQILRWADEHRRRTGDWPSKNSGAVPGTLGEKWRNLDQALRSGRRGLLGGSSLARLLAQRRGVRNRRALPRLRQAEILRWAEAHHRRTGQWPRPTTGPVPEAPGETWHAIDTALVKGWRGLRGGSSLAHLLAVRKGVRNAKAPPRLTVPQILVWADAHRRRTGQWPKDRSGPVAGGGGETWLGVDMALRKGLRGLHGGSSLARLLARRRGVRNDKALPRLTVAQVLAWAEDHYRRTGAWPACRSGPVRAAPGETWSAVASALHRGRRGLPGGVSLAQLLG